MRLIRPSLALAAAAACVAPAGASAVTLGSTERPTAFPALRCDQPRFGIGHVYYQSTTLFGLPSSAAPSGGSISSWRTNQYGGGEPGGTIALVVLQQTMTGVTVKAVDVQTLPSVIPREDVVFTPSTPVGISAGDFIGVWGPDDRSGCFFAGGRSTEAFTYAAVGSTPPTLGAGYTTRTQTFNRVNVAAELSPGAGAPPPPPPPPPTPPVPPTIGPDGRPTVSGRGRAIEVGTGQSVGCSEAGPCRVVSTAVTYFTTGEVRAASAAASRGARRRGRARRRAVVIGRRAFSVAAGGRAAVTFLLNRAGRSALARFGRLRITVTTTVTQGAQLPIVARRTFTIRAPRSARARRR